MIDEQEQKLNELKLQNTSNVQLHQKINVSKKVDN
jgi:hypothetical protein